MEKPARTPLFAVVAVLALAAAALLFVLGGRGAPGDTSPEAGFARDMATHHAQAVDMSFTIRDKTESPEISNLAFDIINTQANQRGMFLGWLEQWGLTQSTDMRPMAWMSGHGHAGAASSEGRMPGLASSEELTRLRAAQGAEAEVLFLQLMIRHHEGGVEMAEGALRLSDREEVIRMARKIVAGQKGEIKLMTDMLAHRDAKPLPSILQ
ncbi:DUF305 domain-containing protein [Nonomuraea sp. MCN248]|uniref:DUF305 domain-containing protein n=1 Tax=Nonomuraea corallina TaxID=2989783 RepID=A0ABT4SLQ4_9ACTN|nr:DUF305 domain-containing protein [Nonomuraea corallina]MDA0637796.1 DUF305 domain-containing protein [Nonomuraea corallina]